MKNQLGKRGSVAFRNRPGRYIVDISLFSSTLPTIILAQHSPSTNLQHTHTYLSQWDSRTVTAIRVLVSSRPDALSATPSVLVSPTRVGILDDKTEQSWMDSEEQ